MAVVCEMQSSAKTAVTSYMASVRFVKHLVKVSLVNIVYHRVNINPDAFEVRNVKEYKYMACKPLTEDPIACSIFYAAKGVADAIENKYLRELYLILKDKSSEDISEYYKFSFIYKEKPDNISLPKSEEVIEASIEFMKNIEMLGTYGKLSSNLDIIVEISFLNNTTPKDYSPPYFRKHISSIPLVHQLPEFMSPSIRVGYINTGYHTIKCRATGKSFNQTPVSTPRYLKSNRMLVFDDENGEKGNEILEETINDQLDNTEEIEIHNTSESNHEEENNISNNEENKIQGNIIDINYKNTNNLPENKETKNQDNIEDLNQTKNEEIEKTVEKYSISDISEVLANINSDIFDNKQNTFLCICKVNEEIQGIENIVCSICLQQQHAVCVGFEKSVLVPDPYVCIYCKREDRPYVDKILDNFKPESWRNIAILRLALMNCKKYKNFTNEVLTYLPKKIQYHACEMLKNANVIERDENKKVTLNYQIAEDTMVRVFNAVAIPDSMQLCDEKDMSTEYRVREKIETFTETAVVTKRRKL